jgi:hypothetical protein
MKADKAAKQLGVPIDDPAVRADLETLASVDRGPRTRGAALAQVRRGLPDGSPPADVTPLPCSP